MIHKTVPKRVWFWLKLCVSVALLSFLFSRVGFKALSQAAREMNVWWLLAGYGAIWCTLLLHTWRWQWLLKAEGTIVPFSSLYHHYMIGYFFGHFLPKIVGGDLVRALSISRFGSSKARSITIIILGRLVGIANLLIIFVVCVLIHAAYIRTFPISISAAAITLGILIGMILGFFVLTSDFAIKISGRIRYQSLTAVLKTLSIYREKKSYLIISFFISTLLQIVVLCRHYLVAQAIGLEIDFATLSLVSILVMGITTVPVTVNGIGLRENGFVFLFDFLSISPEKAVVFSLLNYALMVSMAAIGGMAYVKGVKDHRAPDLDVLSIKEIKEKAAAV